MRRSLPWWLDPWREVRRLRALASQYRAANGQMSRDLDRLEAKLEAKQRELRLAAGTAGWSVGWEQAGAVTPEFVIVGTSRGAQPGVRVYASRELAGTAIRLTGQDETARWKLEAILGRALILNGQDRHQVIEQVMGIWDNWERLERDTAADAERSLRDRPPPAGLSCGYRSAQVRERIMRFGRAVIIPAILSLAAAGSILAAGAAQAAPAPAGHAPVQVQAQTKPLLHYHS